MTARVLSALVVLVGCRAGGEQVRIGSKKFTESVLLGEMLTLQVRAAGGRAVHRSELGGTQVLWKALERGDIDLYPDYTGTIAEEIIGRGRHDDLATFLAAHRVRMSRSLGFNNTYAIGMRAQAAERLGIRTISDLRAHPALRFGFSDEFMNRPDGWPGLRARYDLPQTEVRGLDHDLAYRGLQAGAIDATDLYTTDAEIRHYGLRALEDDRHHFPAYHAVVLYRVDLAARAPAALRAVTALEGRLDERTMMGLNARAKLDLVPERRVAAEFLGLAPGTDEEGLVARLLRHGREHLVLVAISLIAAIVIAIPLGILAARRRRAGQVILGLVAIVQTIPSLALLVFVLPLLGIGAPPAILALFLYSLLPIVQNTHAGLTGIPGPIRESADALGLPPGARLRLVELPMAARTILAGIKTSAVINVGTATLGALVGAGGYGQPILTGIRLADLGLTLQGAVPAAVLALAVQELFELAERAVVPRGLRLQPMDAERGEP